MLLITNVLKSQFRIPVYLGLIFSQSGKKLLLYILSINKLILELNFL
jgi:hypothetical protein